MWPLASGPQWAAARPTRTRRLCSTTMTLGRMRAGSAPAALGTIHRGSPLGATACYGARTRCVAVSRRPTAPLRP